jgi:EmrB/QacA subfamily drug resistance transporter
MDMRTDAALAATGATGKLSAWGAFGIASTAVLLVANDSTMLFAAFGALRLAFPAASAAELSWVLNAYTVVFATLLVPAGGLVDRFGTRRSFLAGLALFLGGSAAAGMSPGLGLLVASRVVQGAGAALVTPSSLAIILAAFPPARRALVVGLWGAASALGAAIGPIAGSVAAELHGWAGVFFVNLLPGVAALGIGWRRLARVPGAAHAARLDLAGMLLLGLAAGALAMAITQSGAPAWSRAELALLAGGGLLALAGFVAWAGRSAAPLVDLALFRSRTYSAVNLATLVFNVAFIMMFFSLFSFLTKVWHYSLPLAGLAIAAGPVTVVPVAFLAGRTAARVGHRALLVPGALVFAAAGAWLMLVPGTQPAYLSQWLPAMLLSGVGVGLVLPSLSGAAVAGLAPARFAVGGAVNQAIRQFGGVLGVALTVRWLGGAALSPADFGPVYGMQIGLALLTGLLCLAVHTRPGVSAQR